MRRRRCSSQCDLAGYTLTDIDGIPVTPSADHCFEKNDLGTVFGKMESPGRSVTRLIASRDTSFLYDVRLREGRSSEIWPTLVMRATGRDSKNKRYLVH